MATEAKVDLQQKTADADAWVITGAAMIGATEGIQKVADDKANLAKKIIEPGDQRNIAHPLDDLVTGAKTLVSGISNTWQAATAPGDMNIDHSSARQPHPIDKTLQAHHAAIAATTEMLTEKGPVEGTRAASAVAAGVVAENVVSPSGKLKAVEAIADVAHDTKTLVRADNALQGEYISAAEAAKAVAIPQASEQIVTAKTGVKDKILNNPAVKMFTDVITPPLDTRIAIAAHNARPKVFAHTDEMHRPGGDVGALHAQSDDRIKRAEKLAEVVRDNPQLMAKNNSITDAQINALIHDTTNDTHLGLEHNPNSVPRLLSPQEQESVNAHLEKIAAAKQAIADEKAYQASLPLVKRLMRKFEMDNANDETGYASIISRYTGSKDDHMAIKAADTESEQLKIMAKGGFRGAATVVTVGLLITAVVLADEKPIDEKSLGRPMSDNEKTALSFANAHLGNGTPEEKAAAMKQLQTPHPSEINSAVDMYLKLQSHLTRDGQLSAQDATALKVATASITGKLAAGEPVVSVDQQVSNTANLQLEQMR